MSVTHFPSLCCRHDLITLPRYYWNTDELGIHYNDVIMNRMASQITSLTIVYSPVYSGADQRKHQSSASLAFVRGIYRWAVNFPHKRPVTRKMFPFDDVIMTDELVTHQNDIRTVVASYVWHTNLSVRHEYCFFSSWLCYRIRATYLSVCYTLCCCLIRPT